MGRPNENGLPEGLRKGPRGYFLDLWLVQEGVRKRVREKIGDVPLAAAKRYLAKRKTEIAEDKFLDKRKEVLRPFDEAADAFLAYSEQRRRSTRKDRATLVPLRAFFGGRLLSAITEDEAYAYIAKRRSDTSRFGRPPSPATINRELSNLKTILNRETRAGHVLRNPLRGFRLLDENNVRDRVLEPEERRRLLAECRPELRVIVDVAYRTGMRAGEIIALTWERVNLKAGFITLRSEDTKTAEGRIVPLDSELVEILQALPRVDGQPRVFLRGDKPIRSIREGFVTACERAGLQDFHFHDLRHCAVTTLARLGVNEKTIMRITGHKTTHMLRRYQRVDETDLQNAAERVRQSLVSTIP